ncbi:hypothetical protein WOLCODRAFT_159501 [Wolfiporia cocos MD-104 SS10]|uniref:Uncharacterized protein n=1 Tax=Wolfiporia cocos (strain MD-104) TaxID=742152 RepID=A0A2H3JL67_WOLCO|nr:hypothetical protein WOLCODRAFT_159501 [Wolfiporia cocos MD-104 SS10]
MSALVRHDRERGGTVHASADSDQARILGKDKDRHRSNSQSGTSGMPPTPKATERPTSQVEQRRRRFNKRATPSTDRAHKLSSRARSQHAARQRVGRGADHTNTPLGPATWSHHTPTASHSNREKAPPLRCPDATGTPHRHQQQQHQRTDKVRHSPRPSTVGGHTGQKASTPIIPPGRRCISQRQTQPLTLPPPRQAMPRYGDRRTLKDRRPAPSSKGEAPALAGTSKKITKDSGAPLNAQRDKVQRHPSTVSPPVTAKPSGCQPARRPGPLGPRDTEPTIKAISINKQLWKERQGAWAAHPRTRQYPRRHNSSDAQSSRTGPDSQEHRPTDVKPEQQGPLAGATPIHHRPQASPSIKISGR